jgi:hypothetical protein
MMALPSLKIFATYSVPLLMTLVLTKFMVMVKKMKDSVMVHHSAQGKA